MNPGKFITVEGTEGAGKSTALTFIRDHLAKTQAELVLTREPGGTAVAEEIRHVLLHFNSSELVAPETELLLMFAARAQHINTCIQPALQAGKWVISDRYVDASYAYQGGGRGMKEQTIKMLDTLIVGPFYPDLTLLMDIPPELGCVRAEKRGEQKDRIEQERLDFFVRVRNAYLDRAKQDAKRIKVIDASQPLHAVQAQIASVLDEFLAKTA